MKKRILLKLSGEALAGNQGHGYDLSLMKEFAGQIREASTMAQIAIVVGGGNLFRGLHGESEGFDRVESDFMGMLATVMNGVAFRNILDSCGVESEVMTPFAMDEYVKRFHARDARLLLEQGKVVIFAGGTGSPFFTTDSAAALRASEICADLLIKATKVDGIYDSDPQKNPDAKLYSRLTYNEVLQKGLKVMDLSAIAICQESKIPVRVLNVFENGNIVSLCRGKDVGTLVN